MTDDLMDRSPLCSFQAAFPHSQNTPAVLLQLADRAVVTRAVAFNFFLPEFLPCGGPLEQMTVMAMPEAAVDEDHGAVFRKDKVGPSRQPAVMQPIPESFCMQRAPDEQLRGGIAAPDTAHVETALLCRQDIHSGTCSIRFLAPLANGFHRL